jgi:hypothetical protein
LVPTGSGGDDFIGIGGPDEGFWGLVVIDQEAIDGGLEIDDALEDAALQAPLGEVGEESVEKEPLVSSGEHNHVWRQKQSSSVGGSARRLSETWHRSR